MQEVVSYFNIIHLLCLFVYLQSQGEAVNSLNIDKSWSITNDINIDIKIQYITTSEKPATEHPRKWFELQKPDGQQPTSVYIDIDNGNLDSNHYTDMDKHTTNYLYIDDDVDDEFSGSGSTEDIQTVSTAASYSLVTRAKESTTRKPTTAVQTKNTDTISSSTNSPTPTAAKPTTQYTTTTELPTVSTKSAQG